MLILTSICRSESRYYFSPFAKPKVFERLSSLDYRELEDAPLTQLRGWVEIWGWALYTYHFPFQILLAFVERRNDFYGGGHERSQVNGEGCRKCWGEGRGTNVCTYFIFLFFFCLLVGNFVSVIAMDCRRIQRRLLSVEANKKYMDPFCFIYKI